MKNRKWGKGYVMYDIIKATSAPAFLYYRPKVIFESRRAGERIRGGALLIANHVSFQDPVLVMMAIWYRRHRFICMQELRDKPYGFLFDWFRCIPIDRTGFGPANLHEIVDVLKADDIVSMFPEGQVHREDESVSSFKSGMILMSIMADKPIIPMYLKPRKNFKDRSIIVIGEPINVKEITGGRLTVDEINKATSVIQEAEDRLMDIASRR